LRKGSKAGYTVRTFFKDQKKILGKRAIKEYGTCIGLLEDFFYDLNKTIIRDQYQWKIGSMLGFLGISKNKYGKIFWYWDLRNDMATLTKKRLWEFDPVVGWQKPVEIGQRGLMKWIVDCDKDPYKPRYLVTARRHKHIK
jgi:hypothetical protein